MVCRKGIFPLILTLPLAAEREEASLRAARETFGFPLILKLPFGSRSEEGMHLFLEITDVRAREILDSRGNPTVEAEVTLEKFGYRQGGGSFRRVHWTV